MKAILILLIILISTFNLKICFAANQQADENVVDYQGKDIDFHILSDANTHNASFEKTAKFHDIVFSIKSCRTLVDVIGGENHSYGAICDLGSNQQHALAEICDDEMVGHFVIKGLDLAYQTIDQVNFSPKDIARFVADNCFGG